jgi:hypothetical protein
MVIIRKRKGSIGEEVGELEPPTLLGLREKGVKGAVMVKK